MLIDNQLTKIRIFSTNIQIEVSHFRRKLVNLTSSLEICDAETGYLLSCASKRLEYYGIFSKHRLQ